MDFAFTETTQARHTTRRIWEQTLPDGTRITVTYTCFVGSHPGSWRKDPSWKIVSRWKVAVTPLGEATETWTERAHTDYVPTEHDAHIGQRERLEAHDRVTLAPAIADTVWASSVGRYLTSLGIPTDNDDALTFIGPDVRAGKRAPTDLELRAVTRLFPS